MLSSYFSILSCMSDCCLFFGDLWWLSDWKKACWLRNCASYFLMHEAPVIIIYYDCYYQNLSLTFTCTLLFIGGWKSGISYYCHWWGNKTISVNFPQLVSKLPKLLRMISQPTVKSFDIHPETQTNIWSALCWFRAGVPLYCASPTEPLKPANWASPSVAREFTQLTQR